MSTLMKAIVRSLTPISHIFRIPKSVASSTQLQRSARYFSIDSRLCIKMYMERENKYAYDIMQNKGYAMDIETPKEVASLTQEGLHNLVEEDWSKKPHEEIFDAFIKLSAYCSAHNICISNTMFDKFIDALTDSIYKATDNELILLFYALNMWPETESIRTRNMIEVWASLDEACFNRVNWWSYDETLAFISLFYMLNVSKVSDFCRKGLIRLAARAKGLTPGQLVQTMFFVGIQRKAPHDIHNLEVHLSNNFSQFSVDELAVMSMGFFKSKVPIRNVELVKKLIMKVMENSKSIHEVSLAALLKIIRYSMKMPYDDSITMLYELLEVLTQEVPRLSVMCNVHIALIATSKLILHKGCLDAVGKRSLENISEARLKDLERLALTYGTLNYSPLTQEDLLDNVIEELRKPERQTEIHNHGRAFACCVSYLGLLGKFPVDLIKKVLSEDFLQHTYGKAVYTYGKEILVINNAAEIFLGEQVPNHLQPKDIKILAKKYTDYVPSEDFKKQYNITEKMVLDVMKILKNVRGGNEFIVGDHILSHHQRGDLILCNSHDGTPLPVSMKDFNEFGLVRRPPDDNKWIVLIIAGRNGTIYGTNTPTGPFQCKLKELQKLGYHTNLVLWNNYTNLTSFEQKAEYLEDVIKNASKG